MISRGVIVTGLRGMVEATGKSFSADWFGKLKMALQCAVVIGVILIILFTAQWTGADYQRS